MKKILRLVFILLTTFLLFYSCNNDNSVSQGGSNPTTGNFSGKITGWSMGTKKLITDVEIPMGLLILDSCIISSDGTFQLSNISNRVPPVNSKQKFYDTTCNCNITIMPYGAKGTPLFFDILSDSGMIYGNLIFTNYTNTMTNGSFRVNYYYCDTIVKINGSQSCQYGQYITQTNFNFTSITGWSKMVIKLDSSYSSPQYQIKFYDITSTVPTGGDWHFFNWSDENVYHRKLIEKFLNK